MTLLRRFRPTAEMLSSSSTTHRTDVEPGDGDDLEYALERADWEPGTNG